MNARTRLFAALRGEPTDRVPVWLLFPYHRAGYYGDVRSEPSYAPVVAAADACAITLNRRHLGVHQFTPEVRESYEQIREGGDTLDRWYIEYRGQRIFAETRSGPGGTRIKRLLSTDAELEFYCALPLNLDPAAITAELDAQLPRYLEEKAEFPEPLGAMMLDLGEPVGVLYHSSNLEEYAVWSLTHADLVAGFLEGRMQQVRQVYRYCLEHRLADVYFLVGSELASPPLVSRATFQRWVVPYAAELIGMIRAAGAYAIQHYHGQIREILPDFLTMAPHALHTIESPPIGDCTLTEAYRVVGDRIALIGNVQYDEFRALTPERMADAVRGVLAEARGRRLILSPTAGPYEPSLTPHQVANYLAFVKTAWEHPWP